MRVRIRSFQLLEHRVTIRGKRLVAKFTAQLDHFKIFQMKLLDCPDRGMIVWAPSAIQLSMEGREAIMRGVMRKLERAERFTDSET